MGKTHCHGGAEVIVSKLEATSRVMEARTSLEAISNITMISPSYNNKCDDMSSTMGVTSAMLPQMKANINKRLAEVEKLITAEGLAELRSAVVTAARVEPQVRHGIANLWVNSLQEKVDVAAQGLLAGGNDMVCLKAMNELLAEAQISWPFLSNIQELTHEFGEAISNVNARSRLSVLQKAAVDVMNIDKQTELAAKQGGDGKGGEKAEASLLDEATFKGLVDVVAQLHGIAIDIDDKLE